MGVSKKVLIPIPKVNKRMLYLAYIPLPMLYGYGIGDEMMENAPLSFYFAIISLVLVFYAILTMIAMLIEDKTKNMVSINLIHLFFSLECASGLIT